jgi:2-methylcitrate dehydratase PrpD
VPEPSARGVADQVGSFAREVRWQDVPERVQRQLALLLLDHAAVCEAGRLAPAAHIAADHASEVYGGDAATALLDGRRLSAPGAAWANGVLANALDYDDGHRLTKGHPGAIVIPAALAVAEAVDASVTELYEAILVGYEVSVRAGILLHAREQQYHASASWGALGVAVAAGRLVGLDQARMRHAVGIAEYHAPIALMPRAVADPAMTKDTCGWGGVIGTTSALLAARGFTGLDSEFMQAREPLALGERWECLELYVKPYPCCRWTQPAIDAALSIRAGIEDPAQIAGVVVRTFAAADLLSRRRPENTEEMQYSLVWPVATALVRGVFGVDEVLGGFDDVRVERLVHCMRVEVDPALSSAFPARRLTSVDVELSDGRTLRSGALEAGGEPGSAGWEDVVLGKTRRHLDPTASAPLARDPLPPGGMLGGRSRDELVALLAFGL